VVNPDTLEASGKTQMLFMPSVFAHQMIGHTESLCLLEREREVVSIIVKGEWSNGRSKQKGQYKEEGIGSGEALARGQSIMREKC